MPPSSYTQHANHHRPLVGTHGKRPLELSVDNALEAVRSNSHIFVHGGAATPIPLLKALVKRAPQLKNVTLHSLHTEGDAEHLDPKYEGIFFAQSYFNGGNTRRAVNTGRAGYVPHFLSEVPLLFSRKVVDLDVALVHVSPPDSHGFCSLGISVDTALSAVQHARYVIAQVNPKMPRTFGPPVHVSALDVMVNVDETLPVLKPPEIDDVQQKIGENVASLIENGSCLQMGIGSIPNAALSCLENHKDIGIHSEMISDGIIPLYEKGIITGANKSYYEGIMTGTFLMGTEKLYTFVHDNPSLVVLPCNQTNNPINIAMNKKAVAINSALEIDLTGQVNADSIGNSIYSGVGGQMDFMRGAALSEGGKPIIALPSTTHSGSSRIVSNLKAGAGVVTTRAHVHYIVTEHGIAHLYGLNIQDRARELIKIAHPRHRETLARELKDKWPQMTFGISF